jgi:hypothetical protein
LRDIIPILHVTSSQPYLALPLQLDNVTVYNPYLVTFLIRTPIFEWYVVWYDSKNGYPKNMCLKGIGLRVQNMISKGLKL